MLKPGKSHTNNF